MPELDHLSTADCRCNSDELNPCPKHLPIQYAKHAAKHRRRGRFVQGAGTSFTFQTTQAHPVVTR